MDKHPVARDLIAWYEQNKRNLPWRNSANPYHIWLSEIILQQTRVDQGMAYYHHFTERYPTLIDLANAPETDVLRSWQGLGYYSRARNLHAAAKWVASNHQGEFPRSYEDIRTLKGVGDYTAAAVASIAFGLPHAAIDGNVNRVMTRLFALQVYPTSPSGKKIIAGVSEQLLDRQQPGSYNQAVMELGALICKPRNPLCDSCPVRTHCMARKQGNQEDYPLKAAKTKVKNRYLNYLVISDANDRILAGRRTGKDIWQGLYQFPLIETLQAAELHDLEIPHIDNLTLVKEFPEIRHILSHQLLHIRFLHFTCKHMPVKDWPEFERYPWSELHTLAFPRAITRFLEKFQPV